MMTPQEVESAAASDFALLTCHEDGRSDDVPSHCERQQHNDNDNLSEDSFLTSIIPNEVWINSFSYLSIDELIRTVGNVSKQFLALSSVDSIWEEKCKKRWKGKQNVRRFLPKQTTQTQTFNGRVNYYRDRMLHHQHNARARHRWAALRLMPGGVSPIFPLVNMAEYHTALSDRILNTRRALIYNAHPFVHNSLSWKESYIMAEIDSRRTILTPEEFIFFKWQLIYNGTPSSTGLRRFNPDGTYESPYMGRCEWHLDEAGRLTFSGMNVSLLAERNTDTWGWTVGKGQNNIVYHSVDPIRTSNE
jgi:hypothetical protein